MSLSARLLTCLTLCMALGGCATKPALLPNDGLFSASTRLETDSASVPEVHRHLLWLKLENLLTLERAQRYSAMAELVTEPSQVKREQFMQLTKCVETSLGPLIDVNRGKTGIRYFAKEQVYQVTIPVNRQNANVLEQWTFKLRPDGNMDWLGLYWLTQRADFLNCAKAIPGMTVHQKKPTPAKPTPAEGKPKQSKETNTMPKNQKTAKETGAH